MSTETETQGGGLEGIAVIGMGARLPGAKTVAEFWKNLCGGVETISFFTEEELIAEGIDPALVRAPNYVKAGGVLGDTEMFDAAFFGLNPREAALMDPQHRVFLECAWEAMEGAGYSPEHQPGRVGVFGGMSMNTYLLNNIYAHLAHVASLESLQASIGNDKDSLTTEVAYRLNLKGPAVTVQSSSSTSLTCIHFACQSLLAYECDAALAGGVSIHFPEKAGYLYYEGGTTAPDGHCHTFDAKAQGFVAGHGAAVIMLKRLEDAVRDGDTIYAVVKGSACNNDGSNKVSYMAPSVEGHAEAIALAQAVAGVTPDSIGYVEAHGTATQIGDPIEVAALTQAFRQGTDAKQFCALGSVKTNIGHLDSAAGAVGFMKVALSLHHKKLVPSLHFETPNPAIDFANSPFFVNTQLRDWQDGPTPRRAGVCSLGMGGTNAHAILEEAPPLPPTDAPRRPAQLLLLSARSDTALETATDRLVSHLKENPDLSLADVAYTLQVGRKRFGKRRAVVCRSVGDAVEALASREPGRVLTGAQESAGRPVMFLFSGQGSQYVDMGRQLYETEPSFRADVDACAEKLKPHLGLDLRTVLYPPAEQREAAAERLKQTSLTQPALFVIEYALAKLWMSWGVKPRAMLGHSIGEYVAACLAGVFSLEDALALVAARGRLMQGMPAGTMLAVSLAESEVAGSLPAELSIAAVNSPGTCVVAGPVASVESFAETLASRGVNSTRLHTSHAFHSSMMDPILEAFREAVRKVKRNAPQVPYLSNVTGKWITTDEATSPDYWAKHLRGAVRFADGVGELLKDADAILLEVGPGNTLATLSRQHPAKGAQHAFISSLRHPKESHADVEFFLGALGRLWLAGVEPDWDAFIDGERRRRVPLPTAPFERQKFWVEPKKESHGGAGKAHVDDTAGADQKQDVSRWFYLPTWKRTPPLASGEWAKAKACWWLFTPGTDGLGGQVAKRLAEVGQDVVTLTPGPRTAQVSARHWTVDPKDAAGYATLLATLTAEGLAPERILHLWGAVAGESSGEAALDVALERGFSSLLFLAQALGRQGGAKPVSLVAVTHRMQALADEQPRPEWATVLGPCRVIPQEYPHLSCRSVDVVLPAPGSWREATLAEALLAECAAASRAEAAIAYRGGQRHAQVFEPVAPDALRAESLPLREGGVYLLLGGFGTLGTAHARALARKVKAKLVLASRTALPERSGWDAWLASHGETDAVSRRIHKVRELETLGAEVHVVAADVADRTQLRAAVDAAVSRFGALHGVVYAAGDVDPALFRAIPDTRPEDVRNHFRSRIQGVYALEEALAGRTLDFCHLASSLAAVLGGLGLASYTAATGFMDAFAVKHTQESPVPWTSVGWDAWRFEEGSASPLAAATPFGALAVSADEGARAFEHLLGLGPVGHVAVSTSSLSARAARWTRPEQEKQAEKPQAALVQADAGANDRTPRPTLQNPYVAPRDELEETIARLWESTLGIAQVGVHDSFFELGGNSLVGVKLIARVREQFGVSIPAVSLYEGPTVHALAKLIKAATRPPDAAPAEEEDSGLDRGARRRARRASRRGGSSEDAPEEEN
ncbi:SDR family NAD(P)-dependent oxidoreductase [Myxococcus sp. RHSTA-1-4]|uniref:type I polyketide synthase n=1 Tax=Myxococcus sp. RHSTA-1-4 TaxID=2874601 RepID=UPI001CBD7EDE|nr:type I polyketide synthase [Myxococcus sp. RHSTA-1-4]MBZ4421925.1 SDR family NAD(P)-dependent oxidoreductase [Myxococcus sp. RHSTA-1-4]